MKRIPVFLTAAIVLGSLTGDSLSVPPPGKRCNTNYECGDLQVCHFNKEICLEGYRSKCGFCGTGYRGVRNVRDYFIQAEQIEWNYLPSGNNLVDHNPFATRYIQDTLVNKDNRIGSTYTKCVFKQYTDETYSQEIVKPVSQGYVGPTVRGEVGEIIRIHLRNKAAITVSAHPHGIRYTKANEGALYLDGTSGKNKLDDNVLPGQNTTFTWKLDENFAPREGDPNCLPFAYHSHRNPSREINAGLVGLLLACKPGTLNRNGVRSDVEKEIILFVDSLNEGESWMIEENLKRCGNPVLCKQLYDQDDPDFKNSLLKNSINGFMFGNMPNLDVCVGQKVAWYIFGLEAQIHPINIVGQTLINEHHRKSVIGIYPATFKEAEMTAINPGRWLVQCMNSENNRAGMKVFLNVYDCRNYTVNRQPVGKVRRLSLIAETVEWEYAPSGSNLHNGGNLTAINSNSEKYFAKQYKGKNMIGGKYKKSRFVRNQVYRYQRRRQFGPNHVVPDFEKHLGLLGPPIRAEVGDVVVITLLNRTPYPVSIYLQGTSLDASQNGMWLKQPMAYGRTKIDGKVVKTGYSDTYTFTIPRSVAPADDDPPCLTYMYYSTVDIVRDINSGLVGPLLICRPGSLDTRTGLQKGVDHEKFLFFSSINENLSWHIDDNIAAYIGTSVDKQDTDFVESNIMRSINGRSYGNLEGLDMCKNDDVIWHVFSFGETEGLHGVKWNGNNVMIDGVNRDSHVTISALTFTALMHPNNIGIWTVNCHNDYHYDAGMTALYQVDACGDTSPTFVQTSGVTRRYYIAAVERKWNYSPKTIHPFTGEDYSNPSSDQYIRVAKDGKFIGSTYTKALYREFTDGTFTHEVPVSESTKHLGVLGPFIRAEVGDTIEVVFKNKASRKFSIHAQGLRYSKLNEGWKYRDGLPATIGDGVPAGGRYTYTWEVPESSGPSANGPNCVNFIYHSAVDPTKDIHSGLTGPIVICRRGILNAQVKRLDDVEREFAVLFMAFDENKSWYIQKNIAEYSPLADTTSQQFEESNKYDSVNGLIFNNLKGLVARRGNNIAWYIMGLGGIEDVHTTHFHGQTYIYRTVRTHEADVLEVFPGTYETVEMFASNPGTWLIHCHVGQHSTDGMIAMYTIEK